MNTATSFIHRDRPSNKGDKRQLKHSHQTKANLMEYRQLSPPSEIDRTVCLVRREAGAGGEERERRRDSSSVNSCDGVEGDSHPSRGSRVGSAKPFQVPLSRNEIARQHRKFRLHSSLRAARSRWLVDNGQECDHDDGQMSLWPWLGLFSAVVSNSQPKRR